MSYVLNKLELKKKYLMFWGKYSIINVVRQISYINSQSIL